MTCAAVSFADDARITNDPISVSLSTSRHRTWVKTDGTSIEADYVEHLRDLVVLKSVAGARVHVYMGSLCEADRRYLVEELGIREWQSWIQPPSNADAARQEARLQRLDRIYQGGGISEEEYRRQKVVLSAPPKAPVESQETPVNTNAKRE